MEERDDLPVTQWSRREIKAHRRKVFCVQFNSQGDRLATASSDQTVRVWRTDASGGPPPAAKGPDAELRGHGDSVVNLRWHPSEPARLASLAASERAVRFWDARSGRCTAALPTPAPNLYLAWAPGGDELAVGNKDDTVAVVDTRRMKVVRQHRYRYAVNELAFVRSPPALLMCTGRGAVEALAYPSMAPVGAARGHPSGVLCLALDGPQRLLATGGADAVVTLWDAADLAPLRSFAGGDAPPRVVAFSAGSRFLAMGSPEEPGLAVADLAPGGAAGGRLPLRAGSGAEDCCWHPSALALAVAVETPEGGAVEIRARHG